MLIYRQGRRNELNGQLLVTAGRAWLKDTKDGAIIAGGISRDRRQDDDYDASYNISLIISFRYIFAASISIIITIITTIYILHIFLFDL